MASKVSEEDLIERMDHIFTRFEQIFESAIVNDMRCFITDKGEYFHLDAFPMNGCLVIEYAANLLEAQKYMLEDGDLFYLEDMDEDEMFEVMLKEINEPMLYLSTIVADNKNEEY